MDSRNEPNFTSVVANNNTISSSGSSSNNISQQQQQQQEQKEDSQEIDHHLIVSGLYDDDESHTRKSSISFDKIKQISLTYSLQSEDDSQDVSDETLNNNNDSQLHSREVEDELVMNANMMVNNGRRDSSSSSNQFCSLQTDGDVSDANSSRKVSVIEVKTAKGQSGNSFLIQNHDYQQQQQQQPDTNNSNFQDGNTNDCTPKMNERILNQPSFDCNDTYYGKGKVDNSLSCKAEDNFIVRNTIPSYLKSNPFVFDQSEFSQNNNKSNSIISSNNTNKISNGNVDSENHNHDHINNNNSTSSGTNAVAGNNIDRLNTFLSLNEQSIPTFGQLSAGRVVERNSNGEIYALQRPQYYGNVSEDIQVGKVTRHLRHNRQQHHHHHHQPQQQHYQLQHQTHDQLPVSRRALSESSGLRDSLLVSDDATLIMGNEIGLSANTIGVDCSPRMKQLPRANSPVAVAAAVTTTVDQQQQLPLPGYPQRDHHVSRRTMIVQRPQQYGVGSGSAAATAVSGLFPPSIQQLSMLQDHSRSSSRDRIVAARNTSRPSTGPESEKSSTNGSSSGLKLKQHNNSISLVLFNKTDANIIISDEPSESCSEESCWGSSLAPNSSIGFNAAIDNSLALGHQGGTNDDDAGVEGNDYLSEEDLNYNEIFQHDTSLNRDKNTTLLRRVSTGGFIGGGGGGGSSSSEVAGRGGGANISSSSNGRLNTPLMIPTRVSDQRLDHSMSQNQNQNHLNQHQMFNVEKFVQQPNTQPKTTCHTSDRGQNLVTNISVNQPNTHENLVFENRRQQQQQQHQQSSSSTPFSSTTINQASVNNGYRHQLPGSNQVINNNIVYSEHNQGSPQFYGNSSGSQSLLGNDIKQPIDSMSGCGSMSTNTGRGLGGSCNQLRRDLEDRTIRVLNNVGEHSLARDEVMMKKNNPEAQANTQPSYMFDEGTNEQFGLIHQSPIIINRVDSNSSRTNKTLLRNTDSNQQPQNQYTKYSIKQASSHRETPTSFYNNINNRRHLASSQADQMDHTSLYEFDGEDDDYAYSTSSVYASPVHLPRRSHTNQFSNKSYRNDGRRVDIVISSPQRYIRPLSSRRTRATGQQFWSNNSLPKSPLQEYLYFDGGQNVNTNNGMVNRRPIADARANRSTQMDYQQSTPSPIGSQSCWSSYGSINRDNITVGSQIENSYDENAQLKLTRLQHQQQKISKQQHIPANYYQAGEFSPKILNEMNMQHQSTYVNGVNWDGESSLDATKLTDERKSNDISHVFEKENCPNPANIPAQQQRKQEQQEQQNNQHIDESCPLQRADLSGSYVVPSEKDSSQIGQDKIGTEVSNQSVQQSKTKEQQQQELSGATKTSTKSSDVQANQQQNNNQTSVVVATATPKPIKLRNLLNDEQTVDNLHFKYKHNNKSHGCSENRCLASMINPKPVEYKVRSVQETFEHAKDFINNFYASIKRLDSPAHKTRLLEIEEQLKTNETYYLKETELIYGAKLAWRNAARCIGRIQWSKLQVFDARFTTNANEMFEALCNHIKYATNKGSLRSAITILPQRVKSINNDWRIWNSQLIGYAGYKNKETNLIIGDPANVEITEICQKLGWKGKGTRFDILPLVLSANGGPPQMFTLPEDLVLRVKIKHPKFKWFEELKLEWYALPAVANMMLDVGGIQFTAAPFSGWYMVTEIGTRDLGDSNRYNVLEEVAQKMGLNTKSNMSLWKDQAVVELNIAVLDSFQQAGVTIVDHHTATDTFMTHLSNEQRLRGGCPADWVWLVPPTSGSTTQVFHQEMVSYHLLPNYEYQEPVWKNFDWNSWEKLEVKKREQEANNRKRIDSLAACANSGAGGILVDSSGLQKSTTSLWSSPLKSNNNHMSNGGELTPRKLRFKEIARAVKFTSKLFGKALSRRIKATILYATETGKSERFANKLAQTFSCAFNVHLMSMSDYDMTCLEHEALLLVVTSTFGNGDPPENGELFAKHLAAVKLTGDTSPDIDSINSVSTNPFFQMLSEDHKDITERNYNSILQASNVNSSNTTSFGGSAAGVGSGSNNTMNNNTNSSDNSNSDSSSSSLSNQSKNSCLLQVNKQEEQTNIRPLSNVRFGVFALGSTAYPHFCAFGRYVDQTLGELGAERILKCTCGDELCGQEKAFNEWSNQVFKTACDVFCLTDSIGPIEERPEMRWSPQDVRFVPVELIPEPNELTNNNNFSLQQQQSTLPGGNVEQQTLKSSELLSNKMVIVRNLMNITNKRIIPFTVKNRINLHPYNKDDFSDLQTLCIDLESDFISSSHINGVGGTVQNIPSPLNQQSNSNNSATNKLNNPITFEAGDHVAIYPVNNKEMVEKILARMREGEEMTTTNNNNNNNSDTCNKETIKNGQQTTTTTTRFNFDQVYTILVKRENMDLTPATPIPTTQNALGGANNNGTDEDSWINHDRLPVTSIREALMRYLDITSPPNQEFLLILSRQTNDPDDRKKLQQIARNFTIYEEWKNKKVPTLLSVLEEFKTIKFEPALVTQIPLIKPRFYSVSGTSTSLTLGVVRFKTISGESREGLCSNYLNRVQVNPSIYVYGYIRSAPAFHMPVDKSIPMILISAGTGIAPFRSFWQQRYADMYKQPPQTRKQQDQQQTKQVFGRIEMYFGCRNSNYILYKDELDEMYGNGVLSSINIAFSRPRDCDVLEEKDNKMGQEEEDSNRVSSATTTTKFMTNAGTGGDHLPNRRISKVSSIKQARKKMYVQDKLLEDGDDIYKLIMQDGAHVYVCGDVAMADGVYKTLANIFKNCFKANKLLLSGKNNPSSTSANANDSIGGDLARSSDDGEGILMNLRNLNRYHEDIFGAKQMS